MIWYAQLPSLPSCVGRIARHIQRQRRGRPVPVLLLLWVRRAADAAHRETFKLRSFSG